MQEEFQQLFPEKRMVDLEEYFSSQDLLRRQDGLYTIGAMVSSLDGRAAWRGTADELRTSKDDALFHGLRSLADAVIVGEHTLQAERYGPIISNEETQKRRLSRGQAAQPLVVVVSKKFDIPWDIPLFQDKDTECLIWTTEEGPIPGSVQAKVEIISDESAQEAPLYKLTTALQERGVGLLLCEGGPTLHAALEREDIIEELFLALEPEMVGHKNIAWVEGDFLEPQPFSLSGILQSGSELFLHYHKEPVAVPVSPEKFAAVPA